jgi:hypothetical protein
MFPTFRGEVPTPFSGHRNKRHGNRWGTGGSSIVFHYLFDLFCFPRVFSGVPAAFCPSPAVAHWLTLRVVCFSPSARPCADTFLHMLPLYHEDGSSTFLWNVFKFLPDYTASRQEDSRVWPDDTPVSKMAHSEYSCASGSFLCFLLIIL